MSSSRSLWRSGWLNLLLLLLTAASTFFVFLTAWGGGVEGGRDDRLWGSAYFTVSVLLILGAHEMGHYLMARAHRVDATLPYFIPVPFGFGTMGAVIRLRGKVPTKNALVDIGAAGPLAGLLIAIPLLVVGTMLSHPVEFPQAGAAAGSGFFPETSLWHFAEELGRWLKSVVYDVPQAPAPEVTSIRFGDNLLGLVLVKLLWGSLPAGTDLAAHPVLLAGWFGMLVTMLNLMPVGQLDGGHLTHAWFGVKAERYGEHVAAVALVLALFCSYTWLGWFFLVTRIVGFKHPPPVDEAEPLSRGRKVVIVITWVMTALTFMPVPLDFA